MEYNMLLKANLKRHKGSLIGIFILILMVSLALNAVLSVWVNSESYLKSEMDRAGFGELTAWVADVPDTEALAEDIEDLWDIERVETQNLIYSDYTVNSQESDSEGQLITLEAADNRYKFFTDDLLGYQQDTPKIARGEVYVSPALVSMFGIQLEDNITFPITRQGEHVVLTVKGYYEDPFMGSAMVGMKGFLISLEDRTEILQTIQDAGMDALARNGAMLHIFAESYREIPASELSAILSENTSLSQYMEFVHSKRAISDFMLVLQNAFSGMLLAFVLILLFVVIIVLRTSIDSAIESDFLNMSILKTVGFTSKKLRQIQLLQYLIGILGGMLVGGILALPLSSFLSGATLTTTGFLIPAKMPIAECLLSFGIVLILLICFIVIKTGKIGCITPIKAMRGETEKVRFNPQKSLPIHGKWLSLCLALRQLSARRQNYMGACWIAVLLVFFASITGRMDAWLGPDGKGMMDAFHPADHDLGIQAIGDLTLEEIENTLQTYTNITDSYLLAMPSVTVNGTPYIANVISEPERFHILQGSTCKAENEIVLTEMLAADLGVSAGSTLTVGAGEHSETYLVSGIYQCANDMGGNIGMSQEGYLKIGQDDPHIFCHHYFLDDSSQKATITAALEDAYGGDIHVHENSWPGLSGIILAMRALLIFMYVLTAIFILIVTIMTGSKVLSAEQKDMAIYKAMGFSPGRLRLAFTLRFGMVSALGSVIGILLAASLTDPMVSLVMKLCGISNFASSPSIVGILLPAIVVILLFIGFAYLVSVKIKKSDVTVLITN